MDPKFWEDAAFWAKMLAASSAAGFAVAFAVRYFTKLRNPLANVYSVGTILLTNLLLLWTKFWENAGFVDQVVRFVPDDGYGYKVAYAGFFGVLGTILKPVVAMTQAAFFTWAQHRVNRWIHEGGVKPTVKAIQGVPEKATG